MQVGHACLTQQHGVAQHEGLLDFQKVADGAQHATERLWLLLGQNRCLAVEFHVCHRERRENPGVSQERDQRFDVRELGAVTETGRPIGGQLGRDPAQDRGTALVGQLRNSVVSQAAQHHGRGCDFRCVLQSLLQEQLDQSLPRAAVFGMELPFGRDRTRHLTPAGGIFRVHLGRLPQNVNVLGRQARGHVVGDTRGKPIAELVLVYAGQLAPQASPQGLGAIAKSGDKLAHEPLGTLGIVESLIGLQQQLDSLRLNRLQLQTALQVQARGCGVVLGSGQSAKHDVRLDQIGIERKGMIEGVAGRAGPLPTKGDELGPTQVGLVERARRGTPGLGRNPGAAAGW